jgi:dipeptidyl aminopeptidase/acylaminoacyl peptidase
VNLVDKIVAPVLFIHGKIDPVIPPEMVRKMIDDLKKVGGKPEALFIDFEDAAAKGMDSRRLQEYKAIEAFLEKHLGAGSEAAVLVTSPTGSQDKQ